VRIADVRFRRSRRSWDFSWRRHSLSSIAFIFRRDVSTTLQNHQCLSKLALNMLTLVLTCFPFLRGFPLRGRSESLEGGGIPPRCCWIVVCDMESDMSLIEVAGGRRCLGLGRSSWLRLELLLLLRLIDEAEERLCRRTLRIAQLR
jgi:hypothetical protein